MSLKGIELQIAIPKTFDAGKVAEQKQQQSQVNQDHAGALAERLVMKKQETVLEAEEFAKTNTNKKDRQEGQARDDNQGTNEEEKKTMHPYKGSFVDYTG